MVKNPNGLYVTNDGIVTHNSTLTVCENLYIATLFAMMIAPYRYYGYAPSTQFTIVFSGFSQKKASELLFQPLMNTLRQSEFFVQCIRYDEMLKKNKEFDSASGVPNVYWTTAAPTAQPLDCTILMADGTRKTMGEVQVGDKVFSPTKGEAEVKAIPYHGIAECYEIELEDGRKTRCSDKHLWKVTWQNDEKGNPIWKVVNTRYILDHPELEFSIIDIDDCEQ